MAAPREQCPTQQLRPYEVYGECEHKIMWKADMLDAQEKLKEIEEEHEKSNGE